VSSRPIVCDTTILLYLGRLGQIGLLPALFDPVWVPEIVALELDMGRLLMRDTVDPRDLPWATLVSVPQSMIDALPPNRLGPGELAVIAYAYAHPGCVAGLDDLQARRIAEAMGLTVAGTLGLLLRAKRAGLVPAVHSLMDAAVVEGFHVSPELYRVTLDLADEAL
jgi:predicted nucleic acid-binding protein